MYEILYRALGEKSLILYDLPGKPLFEAIVDISEEEVVAPAEPWTRDDYMRALRALGFRDTKVEMDDDSIRVSVGTLEYTGEKVTDLGFGYYVGTLKQSRVFQMFRLQAGGTQ